MKRKCSLRWATVLLTATLATGFEQARAGINEWTSLRGPYGGPISALVIDPQNPRTIYAGTPIGVFKTIDGAASWMPASAGLATNSVFGLAIDPQNTSTLYALSGRLLKSTDSAASWNRVMLPDGLSARVMSVGPGVIYVAGTVSSEYRYGVPPFPYGAVSKSLDGGATWSTVKLPDHLFAGRLAIDPQSSNTVYVSAAPAFWSGETIDFGAVHGALLKTTDGGASWIECARIVHSILVVDPETPNTLYGGAWGGGISKSTDGGVTWNAANSGFPDRFRIALALAIDPASPGVLYAVMGPTSPELPEGPCCAGSIFKSTDGGATWSEVNPGVERLEFDAYDPRLVGIAVDPANPGTLYAGTDVDGVFKSTDGGKSWNGANTGLAAIQILAIAADPHHAGTIYATSSRRLYKSDDRGLSWTRGNWPSASGIAGLAFDPQSAHTIYAWEGNFDEGYLRVLFKSTDGGMNWSAIWGNTCGGLNNIVFEPQNPKTLYANTNWCGVYRSTDGGEKWKVLDTIPGYAREKVNVQAIAVDPRNPSTLYANSSVWGTAVPQPAQVYKSLDGGMHWAQSNTGLPDYGIVATVLIDPKTPTTLYAGVVNRVVNREDYAIYKSTDGAAAWSRIGSGNLLAVDPQGVLYSATAGVLFRSTDGGSSWKPAGPAPSFGQLAFDPMDSNTVYLPSWVLGGSAGVFTITFVP